MEILAFAEGATARTRIAFNDSWRFSLGTLAASSPDFDHSSWREVRLPHDWAIEGPFDRKYDARCGGLPFHGEGWYRKDFRVSESCQGKTIALQFDGVMNNSEVWINGHSLGLRPFGYLGFEYDLSPYLNFGDKPNAIAVRCAPEDLSSRWYPGAGIYRNVWLEIKSQTRIDHWGTYVTTTTISEDEALIRIATRLTNAREPSFEGVLETTILDAEGNAVAEAATPTSALDGEGEMTQEIRVSAPRLWDLDDPYLYTAVSSLRTERALIDRYETTFGIRSIEYTAENGFRLNGTRRQFNGVCLHHDLGPLGAAVNHRATERQLEIMAKMGVNAIRTSHNPPSPELLSLCDRMGFLVQVEAFDVWEIAKVENDYHKHFANWHERDLKDMIRRDRNHPCVVMWSVGNEILEQGEPEKGVEWTRRLVAICRQEDDTRPVTAGFNQYPEAIENGLAAEVDLVGLNYKPTQYEDVLAAHPNWIVYGSETSSCVSSRGVYHLPIEKYEKHASLQVTSYDLISPDWAYPPDVEFHYLEENPRVLGQFIWTGFDYLGEPTPFGGGDNSTDGYWNADWPSRSSYFGAVDLCGFPKDRFYLYQSQWSKKPMVHVLPHWNWEGKEGKAIPVYGYTNCDEAELFLNGTSLGRKRRFQETTPLIVKFQRYQSGRFDSKYRLRWDVPYEPGELKIVGYLNGCIAEEKAVRTASEPAGIELTPDRSSIAADGQDLSFVTVQIVDRKGNPCPTANNQIDFEVRGAGELIAVGSGNAATTEPFQAKTRKAFNGKCLLIVRSKKGVPGSIEIVANSERLRTQSAEVSAQAEK